MSEKLWHSSVGTIQEYIVKIATPDGHGTGFLVPTPAGKNGLRCIATAYHVIRHAHRWSEPIRIIHPLSGRQIFLSPDQRNIVVSHDRDQAVIQLSASWLQPPRRDLKFSEEDRHYVAGVEAGWVGFPSVFPMSPCFFHGHISAYIDEDELYLVDGVAINGVSGGPVFVLDDEDEPIIIGLVTEYRPNCSTGQSLPGMSVMRSINPLIKYYSEELKKYKTAQLKAAEVTPVPQDREHEHRKGNS